ncbi:hypothetical protein GmHk_17G049785 [Glycine max]|nr:hypothetical protein GmHk_17G049785 [Glycine max]
MDRFGRIAIQICNLNPKVVLHSMILTKRPDKWKKCPVRQDGQKCNKREGSTKTYSHKLDKRHKSDKHQPLLKRPWYECYTPLTTNHTTILEEAFNLEVPIRLPPMHPPRFHRSIGHNTKECWTLKDKIEELIHVSLLRGWTTTKQERDIEDTKRISIGIMTTTHVISIDERSLVRALTFYQASIDNEFDLDSCNDTSDRGPKLVEELIKL